MAIDLSNQEKIRHTRRVDAVRRHTPGTESQLLPWMKNYLPTSGFTAGVLLLIAGRVSGDHTPLVEILFNIPAMFFGILLLGSFFHRKRTSLRSSHEASGTIDDISGLPDRTMLLRRLSYLMSGSIGSQQLFCYAHIQLDNINLISQYYGRDVGDAVSRTVANIIRTTVVSQASVYSLSKDEFGLVYTTYPASGIVRQDVARLQNRLSGTLIVEGFSLRIQSSIGIACHPDHAAKPNEILTNAYSAAMEAKLNAGTGFELYSLQKIGKIRETTAMVRNLSKAIGNGELSVVYQPIHFASNGRIRSVEALLRWNHPTQGPISPAQFIPVAEHSGLIRDISTWVYRESFSRIASLRMSTGYDLKLSVNVSPAQLDERSIVDTLAAIAGISGLEPKNVSLEITEGLFLRDSYHIHSIIKELKELGFWIILDDFGTGYSTLGYLGQLAVDGIKIDKVFVDEITERSDALSVVRMILELAKALDLGSVVEGVENEAQLGLLRELGCDSIQGYLLSQPQSIDQLETLISKMAVPF